LSRNRMRKSRSSGSVGERGGNDPLYPENKIEKTKPEKDENRCAVQIREVGIYKANKYK
jgi:hypothetical protein